MLFSADDFAVRIGMKMRRFSPKADFGCRWVLRDEAPWSTILSWQLSWISDTGELYAAPLGHGIRWDSSVTGQLRTMTVIVPPLPAPNSVGIFFVGQWHTRKAIEDFLAGWADTAMAVGPLLNTEAQRELQSLQDTAYAK